MSVRPATEADTEEILELIRELADFEGLADQVRCTAEDLRRELFGPDPAARVTLAVDDDGGGAVAGQALWFRTFSTFLGRSGIWLEDLYVRPAYRGRGYGRELVEHLRAQTQGRVEWEVLDWNSGAMSFYERLGAQPFRGWTKYRWA